MPADMSSISNAPDIDRVLLVSSQNDVLNIGNPNIRDLMDLDFPDASGEQPAR